MCELPIAILLASQDDEGDEGPQLEGKTEIDLLESAVLKLTTIARLHAASKATYSPQGGHHRGIGRAL